MKRAVFQYGLISVAILIGVNLITLLILGVPEPDSYDLGEVVGYATIIVSLVPIYFAIRYYRDRQPDHRIGFWRGIGLGLGVAALPSVAFAVYNLIYVTWIDPDFTESYYQHAMESARASMPAAEFEQYAATLEAQQALFVNPFMMAVVMFLTVFLIGLVISTVSAILLSRKRRTMSGDVHHRPRPGDVPHDAMV